MYRSGGVAVEFWWLPDGCNAERSALMNGNGISRPWTANLRLLGQGFATGYRWYIRTRRRAGSRVFQASSASRAFSAAVSSVNGGGGGLVIDILDRSRPPVRVHRIEAHHAVGGGTDRMAAINEYGHRSTERRDKPAAPAGKPATPESL
jgi:hypothetical protein